MEAVSTIVTDYLLPHWPFISALVVFMMVGQVMKSAVFPKKGWVTRKPVWLFYWGRKTLVLQPIVIGILIGLVWRNPEPGITSLPASMGYFAMAGALSVWAYECLKGLAKKQGIDINLPGIDTTIHREAQMPELLTVLVLVVGVYNAVVLVGVRRTTQRLTDSVAVLVARSDINFDRSVLIREDVERHDRQVRRLLRLQGLADD